MMKKAVAFVMAVMPTVLQRSDGRYPARLEACAQYAESLGVNMTSFPDDAVHGIHSITVQDIRELFKNLH